MDITLDQFRTALADVSSREQLGIRITDQDAREILASEAETASFYEIWEQDRGREPANAFRWQPLSIAGFTLSLASIVGGVLCFIPATPTALPGFVVIGVVVAIILSANGLSACAANGTRGRALAIAGIMLSALAVLGGIALITYSVSS